MKAKRMSKAKRVSVVDKITTLPETIIETILCLLPIEEATRTSILSREWRYKWTKIPKLAFSQSTFERLTEEKHLSKRKRKISDEEHARRNMDIRCKLFYAIHQVLLLHQGPINEFTLSMDADDTCFEIDQIILHLSMNHTLKKLTLDLDEPSNGGNYRLPLSIFSLHHLTDLHLTYCDVDRDVVLKPTFGGFGSLTSLTLNNSWYSKEALLHVLSNCPSLKRVCLNELMLEDITNEKPGFTELFECLPVIEHLTIWIYIIKSLGQESVVLEELSTSIIPLKYICIEEMSFGHGYGLTFLGVLMKCSSKLEKIKLEIKVEIGYCDLDSDQIKEYSDILEKYSDVWLEHLNELKINYFRGYELEFEFVKYINQITQFEESETENVYI